MITVNKNILNTIYKKRKPWSKKYDFGHLLVVGGSKQYSGSPTFNSLAALRAGVDLATVVAPGRAANTIASFLPDMIAYPLEGDYITKDHLEEVMKFTKNKNAVVIGGGMTRGPEVLEFIREFLKRIDLPIVIDADAIHALAVDKNVIKNKEVIITPHSREFFVLSGKKPSEKMEERINSVVSLAKELHATILLKGHIDVISNGKKTAINKTGSPYMTKGGCGDTLAGICGALLARGVNCFDAASAGAYINGKAGNWLRKSLENP